MMISFEALSSLWLLLYCVFWARWRRHARVGQQVAHTVTMPH